MSEERTTKLLHELEDLIGLLAQQTDSRATNLQAKWEEKWDKLENSVDSIADEVYKLKKKKWDWFKFIVIGILLIVGITAFETWRDGMYKLSSFDSEVKALNSKFDALKERIVFRGDLIDKIRELEKSRTKEIKELIEEYHKKKPK